MKPFMVLIAERSKDLANCVRQADAVIQRYAGVSANTKITLDEAAWLAATLYLGLEEAKRQQKQGNVHTVVATDTVEARDSAA